MARMQNSVFLILMLRLLLVVQGFVKSGFGHSLESVNSGMDKYFDYASGHNLKNRMPLWIKPDRKVAVEDVMDYMRDHLEGTPLDMTKDIGAGPFGNPYRWRPLTWQVDGVNYCNERATATQQTGFIFVAQSRSWFRMKLVVYSGLGWTTLQASFYSNVFLYNKSS